MEFKLALRFLFYAIFACTYLLIYPVVGLPQNPLERSIHSTNSTVPDSNGLLDGDTWWGLWSNDHWECQPLYNEVLDDTSEFDKAGSSGASTIMALLPALMAFSPVVTANIGFLSHLSTSQGFIAAAFTFGLPVCQLDTWKPVTVKVKDLVKNLKSGHDNTVTVLKEMVDILAPIKDTVHHKRPLSRSVMLFRIWFSYLQGFFILSLITLVPKIDSFYLIWLCPDFGSVVFSIWLATTFALLGWLRVIIERDSFNGDEVIYISEASTRTGIQIFSDPHPMIVILCPSKDSQERKPRWTNSLALYGVGVFQLFWIGFLSFLFSSTIGGALFQTLCLVVAFMTIVSLSRGLSIIVCLLARKYLDLKVIEYDSLQEKRMIQRLLGGLTDVLLDIRCMNYKKDQWEETTNIYKWGHQLSRGNVVSDDPQQCTHTKPQLGYLLSGFYRACIMQFIAFSAIVAPNLGVLLEFDAKPSEEVQLAAGVIITLMSTAFCMHLGHTKRLLICNCCSTMNRGQ